MTMLLVFFSIDSNEEISNGTVYQIKPSNRAVFPDIFLVQDFRGLSLITKSSQVCPIVRH